MKKIITNSFNDQLNFVAFPRNYPLNKVLFKTEAFDIDSGANGHIRYELLSETRTTTIFTVNPDTGEVCHLFEDNNALSKIVEKEIFIQERKKLPRTFH